MLKEFYIEEKSKKIDTVIIFLALIMIGLIPIVSYRKDIFSISPVVTNAYFGTGEKINIFTHYKAILTYLFSGLIFLFFSYKVLFLEQKFKQSKLNIFVGVFILGIVLSLIFADFKEIALWGSFERNEGALAWICYSAVFFVVYNINIEKKYFKYFYFTMYPFLIINATLGVMNIYSYNVLQHDFVQTILGGGVGGTLWTTLYNPNFSSGMCGVIFSVGFMYLLLEKDIKIKILLIIGNMLSFTIVLTSFSVSGFLAIVVSLPIIFLIACKLGGKKNICVFTIIQIFLNSIVFIILNKKNIIVFKETLGIFVQINQISKLIIPVCLLLLITLAILIKYLDGRTKKKILNYSIIATLLLIIGTYSTYSFMLHKEENMVENSPQGSVVRMQNTPLYQRLEEMSNGRITIWQETIRYTNNRILTGQGFDTLPYTINHNKMEGVYEDVAIDKPHNLLLTVLYGSGVLGAVGFISIMIYLIIKSLYSLIDNKNNIFIYVWFIGVIAFLVQGILNDTLVGTAIIFWIMAGMCANQITSYEVEKSVVTE